jgi:hypothetical protein
MKKFKLLSFVAITVIGFAQPTWAGRGGGGGGHGGGGFGGGHFGDSVAAVFDRRPVLMIAAHTSPGAALADLAGHRIPTMAARVCLLQIRADQQQQSADQRVRGRPESRLQIANQIAQAQQ